MQERARQSTVRMALKDIADAMGDVDAFIAQYDPATRMVPKIAADIAARLLAAGRAADALGFVERAEVDKARWISPEWQDARLAVLEALGCIEGILVNRAGATIFSVRRCGNGDVRGGKRPFAGRRLTGRFNPQAVEAKVQRSRAGTWCLAPGRCGRKV